MSILTKFNVFLAKDLEGG